MAKILNATISSDLMHRRLQEQLEALQAVATAGDWERLESMSGAFLATLYEITFALKNPSKFPVDRTTLEKSLKLLHDVTELCLTRKSQIAPLISALSAAKKASGAS